MTTDAQDFVERLTNVCKEAKQLLSEIRSEEKEMRRLIHLARQTAELMDDALATLAKKRIREEVELQLVEFGEQTKQAMQASVQHVNEQFDRLANILMTGNSRGRPDIAATVSRINKARKEKEDAGFELPRVGRQWDDPMR